MNKPRNTNLTAPKNLPSFGRDYKPRFNLNNTPSAAQPYNCFPKFMHWVFVAALVASAFFVLFILIWSIISCQS